MSQKVNKELREEVRELRKKELSFNEIARLLKITPQYAHYLTKDYKKRRKVAVDK